MSRDFYSFIADTYYPSLAQFGIIGIILYISFWIYILKKAISFNKGYKQTKLLTIVLLIVHILPSKELQTQHSLRIGVSICS